MEKKKLSRAVPKGAPILCSMKFCTGFAEIEMAGKKKKTTTISLTDRVFSGKFWQHLKCQL